MSELFHFPSRFLCDGVYILEQPCWRKLNGDLDMRMWCSLWGWLLLGLSMSLWVLLLYTLLSNALEKSTDTLFPWCCHGWQVEVAKVLQLMHRWFPISVHCACSLTCGCPHLTPPPDEFQRVCYLFWLECEMTYQISGCVMPHGAVKGQVDSNFCWNHFCANTSPLCNLHVELHFKVQEVPCVPGLMWWGLKLQCHLALLACGLLLNTVVKCPVVWLNTVSIWI